MATIGFIGLGHMGLPMALNLVKAGHRVTGFDLQTEALNRLVEAGGIAAQSLAEAAHHQDAFITMLQTGKQVESVCLGAQGLFAAASPGTLFIDCSSIDVSDSRNLYQQALEHQLIPLDAPVSGGVAGASAGTLTFMVGAEADALERATPILEAMAKKIIHTGPSGSGQAAKICNNMILGISMIAVSEAFVLAEHLGLSAEKLFEVVTNSSGQCWSMSQYTPVPNIIPNCPANNNYQPGFSVAMMLKDLHLSQDCAKFTGVDTKLGATATRIYEQFDQSGHGQFDFSAIIKAIEA